MYIQMQKLLVQFSDHHTPIVHHSWTTGGPVSTPRVAWRDTKVIPQAEHLCLAELAKNKQMWSVA